MLTTTTMDKKGLLLSIVEQSNQFPDIFMSDEFDKIRSMDSLSKKEMIHGFIDDIIIVNVESDRVKRRNMKAIYSLVSEVNELDSFKDLLLEADRSKEERDFYQDFLALHQVNGYLSISPVLKDRKKI